MINEELIKIHSAIIARASCDNYLRTQQRKNVDCRKIFCYLARKKDFSYNQIAHFLKQDHATVMHSCKTCENLLEFDSAFRDLYNNVLSYYTQNQSVVSKERKVSVKLEIRTADSTYATILEKETTATNIDNLVLDAVAAIQHSADIINRLK